MKCIIALLFLTPILGMKLPSNNSEITKLESSNGEEEGTVVHQAEAEINNKGTPEIKQMNVKETTAMDENQVKDSPRTDIREEVTLEKTNVKGLDNVDNQKEIIIEVQTIKALGEDHEKLEATGADTATNRPSAVISITEGGKPVELNICLDKTESEKNVDQGSTSQAFTTSADLASYDPWSDQRGMLQIAIQSLDQSMQALLVSLGHLSDLGRISSTMNSAPGMAAVDTASKAINLRMQKLRSKLAKVHLAEKIVRIDDLEDLSEDAYKAARQAAKLCFLVYQAAVRVHSFLPAQMIDQQLDDIKQSLNSANIAAQNALLASEYIDHFADAVEDNDIIPPAPIFFTAL